MQQASHICNAAQQARLRFRNRPASKQSANPNSLSCNGCKGGLQGLQGNTDVQHASLSG